MPFDVIGHGAQPIWIVFSVTKGAITVVAKQRPNATGLVAVIYVAMLPDAHIPIADGTLVVLCRYQGIELDWA